MSQAIAGEDAGSFFLNASQLELARRGYALIKAEIDPILDRFYGELGGHSVAQSILRSGPGADALKRAQKGHWDAVLETFDPKDHAARARRVGEAHARVGLKPALYVGSYGVLLGHVTRALLRRETDPRKAADTLEALTKVFLMDMEAALSVYGATEESGRAMSMTLSMSDMVDREVEATATVLLSQASQLSDFAGSMSAAAETVERAIHDVTENSRVSMQSVEMVAAAAEELQASNQEISRQIAATADLTSAVAGSAREAAASVAGLEEATRQIAHVVKLINDIAGKTKLLALNATIEAARAGEAGRGFAVVANEVKSLAAQTEQAIRQVSESAAAIGTATRRTVDDITGIGKRIDEIDQIAGGVAEAVRDQLAATQEISQNIQSASDRTRDTASEVGSVAGQASETRKVSSRLADMAKAMTANVAGLQERMRIVVRSAPEMNVRKAERVPIIKPVVLTIQGSRHEATAADMSPNGMLVRPAGDRKIPLGEGTIEMAGIGTVSMVTMVQTDSGMHLRFRNLSDQQEAAIIDYLRATERDDQAYIRIGTDAATRAARAMTQAVEQGRISLDHLFDIDYVPIEGTDPQQFTTRFVELTDELLTRLQDEVTASRDEIKFCCAIDRNGYIGTHISAVSKPQRPGDPIWNAANCRNRRMFTDKAGMLAARNTQPHLIQSYARDMGGGIFVLMKEVDVPIRIRDRFWGNMRLAWVPSI